MRLTAYQRSTMETWLAENMVDGRHSATWAAEQLAPMLGLGADIRSDWDVLHPLATEVRRWCKEHKAKPLRRMEPTVEFGWERRKQVGWDVDTSEEHTCIRCGSRFRTNRKNARRCPACIAAGLDCHGRKPIEPRRCAECGVEFTPKVHNAKYCSYLCKERASVRAYRERRQAKKQADPYTD